MLDNPLIYGKNQTQKIVNVEANGNKLTYFVQKEDGSVEKFEKKNKLWILSARPIYKNSVKLKGELHYKYGTQFESRDDWLAALNYAKKQFNDTYIVWNETEAALIKDGYTYYKGLKHNEPTILSFDIESTGLYHTQDSKVLLISNTFRKNGVVTRKLFCFDEYESQGEMLLDWCKWIREMDPSLIIAHNGYSFDLPYLQFIAEKEGVTLSLGRDGSPLTINERPSKFRIDGSRDQEYHKVKIWGREVLDTMFLAIRYDTATKKYNSYGLKSIIKTEGLEKEDRVMYDASQIRINYKDPVEWEKIKAYCEHDADDSLTLYDLMAPSLFYLTQSIPKTFQNMIETATGAQLNVMMVRSYLQNGHSIPKATPAVEFQGAISFGNPGIYRNTFKADVASLYPSIILACDVYDQDKDPDGNFLKIMQIFTEERLKNKKLAKESKYHDDLQSSMKTVINSGYGFLGAQGLNFNSPPAADFITKTGREILQMSIDWAISKKMKLVNGDTDSISFCKLDESPISEQEQIELLEDLNKQFPNKIRFEHDGYYPTVCVLKAKNYILYDGKKIKTKGSAIKATTKPEALKEFINRSIHLIVHDTNSLNENLILLYNEYVKEINNIKDIKRWAARKTISDKTLNSDRTNEARIREALVNSEYVEGDRAYFFYKNPTTLELVERFNGEYDKKRLLKNLYDTAWLFETVIDCDLLFTNYSLKKNLKELERFNE